MTVRLTMILSGQAYEQHEFETFTRVLIGRSPECDIRIENLGVSRHHCELVNQGGLHQLRALGKSKTFVNGGPIRAHSLNDGDMITLGKFTIAYANDDPWSGGGPQGKQRGVPAGDATLVGGEKARQAAVESRHHVPGYLKLSGGPQGEATVRLEQPFYLFGKASRAEFVTGGMLAPRLAAVLIREDTGFRLMDLSPKGELVRVNGKVFRDGRLNDGDEVQVREYRFRFFHGTPDA